MLNFSFKNALNLNEMDHFSPTLFFLHMVLLKGKCATFSLWFLFLVYCPQKNTAMPSAHSYPKPNTNTPSQYSTLVLQANTPH